jgi:hypothetical protein
MRVAILCSTFLALACNPGKSGGDTGAVGSDGGSADGGSADGGSDSGSGDGGSGDGGGEEPCEVDFTGSTPGDGDTDVFYRDDLSFELSDADASATVAVLSDAGVEAAGTTWWDDDGLVLSFTPTDGLSPDTDYTATLSWCGGTEEVEFTTSALGTPVEEPEALVGRVYSLDLANARWVEPEGVGDYISGMLTTALLVSVEEVGADLRFMGAMSTEGTEEQDVCLPTTDFPDADFAHDPYFQIGPQDLTLALGGYEAFIRDFELSGVFTADGDEIARGQIVGQIDIRDIADALAGTLGTSDPDTICGYLVFLGAACETCDSDGSETCLDVHIDQIDAPAVDGAMESIAQQDCHEDCEASYSNADCDTSGW